MYATPSDLIRRYRDAAVSGAQAEDLLTALQDATEEVNSYLATRYGKPLATVPDHVVRVTCDIANYLLASDAALMTEERRLRYEDAVAWLKGCADGKPDLAALTTTDDGNPETDETTTAEITYQQRLFTRNQLAGVM